MAAAKHTVEAAVRGAVRSVAVVVMAVGVTATAMPRWVREHAGPTGRAAYGLVAAALSGVWRSVLVVVHAIAIASMTPALLARRRMAARSDLRALRNPLPDATDAVDAPVAEPQPVVEPDPIAPVPDEEGATLPPHHDDQVDVEDDVYVEASGSPVETVETWELEPIRSFRGPLPDDRRAWPVKAANVLVGSLAGVIALIMIVGALGPRVVTDVVEAVEVSLRLPENTELGGLAGRSVVYAADGSVLTILHGEVDRNPVGLNRIPPHVWQAVVAAEDRKFFDHEGYDIEGLGRALLANIRAGGVAEGGSTITQQLAKMNFVGDETTLQRKLSEIVYAVKLEQDFTKEQLLERYLNQIYFGAGAYGVQAAAEEYFGVNVGDLTTDQAALLAGVIPNPSTRNPRVNPEAARDARDSVLNAMALQGYVSEQALPVYKAREIRVIPARPDVNREPYVIEAVKREFFDNPAFGATRQERIDRLFQGGLDIHTTIEPRLQDVAAEVVEDHYPTPGGPTASIAAVDPATGAIKAIHSGQEFEAEQYDIATQGRRQPGSAFKTFVLAEALSQGFPPDLTLDGSSPVEIVYDEGRRTYEPQNYGGASYGTIDMRTALRNSVNTYFVQLFVLVGMENAVEMADAMGINVPEAIGARGDYGPSLTLGGLLNGVTPLEMASAYALFANEGVRTEPYLIDRVLQNGDEVLQRQPRETQVLDPGVNGVAVDMLQTVVDGGTGTAARLSGWDVAGKTGTTNDNTDAWFVGTTPVLSTAVWVGHPDGQVGMPGATGGGTAAPIWQDFMSEALDGVDPVPFPDYETPSFEGAEVDVPDVRGMWESEALQELAESKLVGVARRVNSHAPEGRVIWQDPGPSDTSNAGSTVVFGVSNGVPPPPPEPEPEPEETEEPDDSDESEDSGDGEGEPDSESDSEEGGGESESDESGDEEPSPSDQDEDDG